MDSLKIDDGKIMITLTEEDLDFLSLSSGDTEEVIAAVLPWLASGVDLADGDVFCEAFELGGEVSLFFTINNTGEDGMKYISNGTNTGTSYSGAAPTGKDAARRHLFAFSDFEDLLAACRELSRTVPKGASSLLISSGRYYLALPEKSPIPCEFSGEEADPALRGAIHEMECAIARGAVEALSAFAV